MAGIEFACKKCGNVFTTPANSCSVLFLDFAGENGEIVGGNKGYWHRCPVCGKSCGVIEQ